MKRTAATVLSAVASFILILCILFAAVWFVLNDQTFFELELQKLGTNTSMGMSLADQSLSLKRLTDYMQGKVEDINVEVTVNGELVQMFDLEVDGELIEHVHMEEVRQVWTALSTYRNLGLVIALSLYAAAALIAGRGFIVSWLKGYLSGLALFVFVGAFVGTWAVVDFDAFWTLFHNILFPTSTTWMLPEGSRMIQMLTSEFFSDTIVRIVLIGAGALAVLALISAVILLILRRKKPELAKPTVEEDDEPIMIEEIEGPNLIIEHKRRNLPVHMWDKIELESEERQPEAEPDMQAEDAEPWNKPDEEPTTEPETHDEESKDEPEAESESEAEPEAEPQAEKTFEAGQEDE
ncbi:MAG: DUF1461 domain-containing protein [Clostridia bacterium]|nr:DUF1461 domain-containing protein [Clostridia bacterium]